MIIIMIIMVEIEILKSIKLKIISCFVDRLTMIYGVFNKSSLIYSTIKYSWGNQYFVKSWNHNHLIDIQHFFISNIVDFTISSDHQISGRTLSNWYADSLKIIFQLTIQSFFLEPNQWYLLGIKYLTTT